MDVDTLTEQKITISRLALLTYLTPEQVLGIEHILTLTDDQSRYFKIMYTADDEYWVNSPAFRGMLDMLATQLSISAEVVTAIKRLGDRKKTLAEKIMGRNLTANDIREARV